MGSHVSLGPEIWPFFGGAGGHSIGWQPVLLVRNPTDKKMPIFLCFVTVPMSRFSSKTDRGWPLAPPIGAVRTEKTSGGKLQNTGILGHFGPGRLLALREILGLGQKWKNTNFRCWGSNGVLPRGEKHTPFSSALIRSLDEGYRAEVRSTEAGLSNY